MLEGLVAWVLNTYLGKYVTNLNTDQLSIALLKGAVELENLPLRKDALREFDLPFEVKAGFIGKITLQIPFYRPHSDPWVISMSQLNLIIGPAQSQEYDGEKEREEEMERKKRLLKALEDKFKSECEQRGESYWYSVTASVVTRIVENIELNIQDVHLRFEDDFSNPEKPFSFGVCIYNVSAQNPSKEAVQKLLRQKQLEIEDFSVYWDTECEMLGKLPVNQIQEAMTQCMQSREHQYIFEPVCASVLLRRNASKEPLRSRHTPRIEGQVQLEPMSLRLSQVQYEQITAFLKELDRREREMLYRKWRPKVPVTGHCRQWWMFAIEANLNEIREQRRRGSWDFALKRARDAQTYTSLYFRTLKGVPLSPQEECELERVEEEQTLEEVQSLREIVHDWFRKQEEIAEYVREPSSDPPPCSPTTSIPKSGSSGMIQYLQSWFPGWGGWYGDSQDPDRVPEELLPSPSSWDILAETEDLFDPLEDSHTLNTFTRRDHLFARLEFLLEKGGVTLFHQDRRGDTVHESGVIQLEFSGVKVILESLPRSESSLLSVKLGGLFLRDLTTQGTIFPVLVSPKTDKVVVTTHQASGQSGNSGSTAESLSPPVFEMIYERNPVRCKFERRLEVNTSPLNIIYNPQAIKKVTEFFYKGRVHTSGFGYQSELELRVAEAARRQYNKLKMQTKAEIRQTIDQLLVGEFIENSKRWTMKLDICAPQVIFPDDFQSGDPMLVVIDLGRILLTNSQDDCKTSSKVTQPEREDMSDDEYQTPLATPPDSPPPELDLPSKERLKSHELPNLRSPESTEAYRKKLYEKYSLSFKDLQIMVGRYKDNWKHLQESEVGPTHVVEKFNVLLQLEQRLRYTSDPQLPGAVLSGTLPDLKVHINLEKMTALRSCLARLSSPDVSEGDKSLGKDANIRSPDPLTLRHDKIFQREDSSWKLQGSAKNLTQSVMTLEQHTREVLVESRLLLAEFNINYMQLGVESDGRYISVLKVFGTNAHFVKRPYDAEVSLTVHGLLLVDTLQTYGSDFDLLVASHKHLSFDIPTGSLRESQPSSPTSPDGRSPEHQGHHTESYTGMPMDRLSPLSSYLKDQEALIRLEYQFVSSDCPSMNLDSSLQVTSMQVNNLDIILNPETMVELLKFLQKSFPKEESTWASSAQQHTTQPDSEEEGETFQATYDQNKELTVEIHRLNLLLLRTVSTGTVLGAEKKGLKIATASITGTKVNVSMGSRLDINGSLGAMQLVDLTQEGGRSQFVVSIGNVEDSSSTLRGLTFLSDTGDSPSEALNFRLLEKTQGECSLTLQMASLHYNHSAKFLKELSLSANEVEDNFRSMLKSAATKVSTVLATKTAEYSGMVSLFETPSRRSRTQSQSWAYTFEDEEDIPMEEPESTLDTFLVKLTLDISIESPVVSIPRKPGHPELLVGHLGSIKIHNFDTGQDSEGERLQVLVKDIRLYSLNLSHLVLKKAPKGDNTGNMSPSHNGNINQDEPQLTRHDFFESLSRGKAFHILKDTTIQFTLEKVPIDEDNQFIFLTTEETCKSTGLLRIEGKFVNPVQVFLCKPVYEQVLQTLDNLSLIEEQRATPSQPPTPPPPTPSSTRPHRFPDPQGGLFARDPPHISFSHSSLSSPSPLQAHKPAVESSSFTQLKITLHVAELQVQLSADLTQGSQGLVSLRFQDLEGDFTKDHPHLLAVQLALRSLLMEDLLEPNPESKYKHLMVSRGAPKPSTFSPKEYLSQSCPSASNALYPEMPRSLPAHVEEAKNVFQLYQRHPSTPSASSRKSKKDPDCPSTPPPSPTHHTPSSQPPPDFDESLVHINVLLVDQNHPEFKTRYGSVGRSVDVDFNCLDVLITLQTWVVILDFFGIGSTANNHAVKLPTMSPQPVPGHPLYEEEATDVVNTKVDLKVHSLSLILNKKVNELARASVSKLSAHLEMLDGNLALQGSLGSLSLSDLTPHGDLYRERFTTRGGEALNFNIHRYGQPDPYLEREYDIKVSLQMASVQYVHTQRFQAEVVAFIQHFTQLQDVLGRQRAAMEGQAVRDHPQRASRVLLDIQAGAPVILIPESSRSPRVIVANLGQLRVQNCFLPAGAHGTFSLQDKVEKLTMAHAFFPSLERVRNAAGKNSEQEKPRTSASSSSSSTGFTLGRPQAPDTGRAPEEDGPHSLEDHVCLLDCIALDLQEMDIFAAERLPCQPWESVSNPPESSDLIFPSYSVRRTGANLLKDCCRLKLKVERNLDNQLSHAVPDMSIHGSLSSVHCCLNLEHYQLIRGLLENNLGEPIEEFLRPYNLQDPSTYTVLSGDVYTNLTFLVDMMDVSLELLDNPKASEHKHSLARFDFMKSKLLFESFSNGSKSVNLVSHSLLAYDTRPNKSTGRADGVRRNVFDCILQPSKTGTNRASLQLELHYRSTRDSSCFTMVLNNLRVFLIFDWLQLVRDFLRMPVEKPSGGAETREHWPSNTSTDSGSGAAAAATTTTTTMPKTVKSGVVTKRSTVPVTQERYLEVKINVTGTEFVVVEDSSCLDTNAIILKGTTVLTYKPRLLDRPFSGSLAGIEVFSCRLGSEQETALSIIDPVNVQVELCGSPTYQSSSGLLDAFNVEDIPPLLEIQFPALDIRLSYNDIQLFLAIAKSIPTASTPLPPDSDASAPSAEPAPTAKESFRQKTQALIEGQLTHLQELGFKKDDCKRALIHCKGQLDQAATWLLENAENIAGHPRARSDSGSSSHSAPLSGVEVKAESVCICFIDDCMDCDIPLAELTFSRLYVLQRIGSTQEGNASFTLSGDYYNRELSGWEPFIEPWPCFLSWQQQAAGRLHPPRLKMGIRAKQRLDINITSVLLEQYNTTKSSWMADYCNEEEQNSQSPPPLPWVGSSVDPPSFVQNVKLSKRRQPFVPYALRNHTGCTMWFATLTTTPTRVALSHSSSADSISEVHGPGTDDTHNVSQWREVLPGEEIPFEFEAREKLRHRHTHELKLHQLLVRVCGWEQVKPVSVDKVGIFFRYAAPDKNSSSNTVGSPISRTNIIHPHVYFSALPPVRVVFSITMEGSARKVITVRSALIVKNRLDVPMEVRLDSPSAPDKPVVLPPILPGQALAVPLHLTSWRLQARPKGLGLFFCKVPIHWTTVERPGEISSSKRECQSADFDDSLKRNFRFCVVIRKENYPDQQPAKKVSGSAKQIYRQPGHTIYLLPTMVLANLLPCEINFYIKGTSIKGSLKPGKEAVLHAADTSQNMELGVLLENFAMCKELLIPPGTQNYVVRMRLYDTNKRLLCLTIRIILRAQGALKILISAPYWLINKTGLPLIFRQDNGKTDAAGQFEEHELARSLSPLLFCYTDKEQPAMCTMRIGKGIHPDGVPGWCQGFSLDGGSGVRAVKVIQHGNRPGLIYNIGKLFVRKGKGRYRDTHIVTFAPRYLLDNRSTHKLAFAQREFARGKGTVNPEGYISTLPGSSVVFHWPRNDYDQLLCVRLMDTPNCTWSGGFEVNKPKSFHVNMRDTLGNCFFLRTEITLKGATYQISFTDTDQLPPPFRIDNISEVPIQFWQHGVADIRLHTEVKDGSVLDYACDEPTLPPYLTLTVKGAGSSEVTSDMNFFREYNKLYYENFIYIAATHTFSQNVEKRSVGKKHLVRCAELVLDVDTKTQRVILKKKEPGKRSQLWRMTGTGMLCHEGSSPPQSKPAQPRPLDSSLVLDIAGLAAVSDNSFEPLMLRRPDSRRSTTQTWYFSSGMLTCGLPRLVVQVKCGVTGLYDGAEVVLGPDSGLNEPGPEQQFINQKMRPGSGVLSVQVLPDGPTRVLQISDFNQRRMIRSSPSTEQDKTKEDVKKKEPEQELEVLVNLEEGVGVSLVNKVPEELVFTTLSGIDVHFTRTAANEVLELSIQSIQVDNQLLGTTQPVMLCVTPSSTESGVNDSGPALQVNSVKVPSNLMLTDLFKHLMVTARRFTVIIEEKLLLKLLSFFGYGQTEELEKLDENLHERPNEDLGPLKRYYFENLKISLPQVKLSVFTSHKLPMDLKALKGTLGFPLVRFEDAVVNMYPFTRVHPYETQEIIINDILKHFREELMSQAAQILGSVDFLGNPMGLLNDVTEGVSELIKYGNVGGLIRNVTHGVSNSAAKFAGTLSDGLGKTMDNRHQSEREYIRYHGATSGEHLVAGIHGLAHGIIGGMTSIITSTVEGVKTEGGVSGFFSGLGKGLVGTVTKPVAGALDFASETAQTVRDMASLSNHRLSVQRVRKPRCCKGPQGLLPRHSSTQADGQEQLFRLTDNIHSEFFIAVELIDSYCVLISSKVVYFLKPGDFVDREAIFLEVKYDDLYHCLVSKDHGKVYVQLTKKAESTSSGVAMPGPSHQKPMVHVKSENLAIKISQEINYAKSLYYEQQLMLPASDNEDCLLLES
ncbi:intermembrane lipid transfer protein VPS13D isoform X2 [Scomber scombrus]|uniref:Intermembrane lipid transfer protein VPS13D isoform X2 n=1 Tax=Scomber scombrus TaxID=13677 RepID=A0AAV1PVR0_SCOSC